MTGSRKVFSSGGISSMLCPENTDVPSTYWLWLCVRRITSGKT